MSETMTSYEKNKLERLERYERAVKGAIETIDVAIRYLWAIIIVGVPVFLYFKPLETNGTMQAAFALVLILFQLLVAVVWRAVGKSDVS